MRDAVSVIANWEGRRDEVAGAAIALRQAGSAGVSSTLESKRSRDGRSERQDGRCELTDVRRESDDACRCEKRFREWQIGRPARGEVAGAAVAIRQTGSA